MSIENSQGGEFIDNGFDQDNQSEDFNSFEDDNREENQVSSPAQTFNDYSFSDDENSEQESFQDENWTQAIDDDPRVSQSQRNQDEDSDEEGEQNQDASVDNTQVKDFTLDDILNQGTGEDYNEENEDSSVVVDNQNLTVENAISFLKEKGLNVEQPKDLNAVRVQEIGQLNNTISDLTRVINMPDSEFLKVALRNELVNEYNQSGRTNLINSEEFEDSLTDQLDELEINQSLKRMVIQNHKLALSNFIGGKKADLTRLEQENLKAKEQEVLMLTNQRLQSIEKLTKENGLSLHDAQKALAFIKSDEYKSLVNNSDFIIQSVFAELARRDGKKLFNNDNSYGRGVNDTLEEIKKNGSGRTSNSQLTNQMKGSQHFAASSKEINPWLTFNTGGNVVEDKNPNKKRAAGMM